MGQPEIVFFDLETTGFVNPIRPLQIGAVNSWGNRHFNCSIIPGTIFLLSLLKPLADAARAVRTLVYLVTENT